MKEKMSTVVPRHSVFRLDFTGSSVGLSGIIKRRLYAIDWLKYSVYRILF